jgi:fructose transport system ATP-binding protein
MTTQEAPTKTPVLEAKGLVKRYGNVTALNGADFELFPGEILAVIGDNGAGKSTLIKCISGAEVPDSGTIWLEGKEVLFKNPLEARAAGIEAVYQTLAVAPSLDIASNLFLVGAMNEHARSRMTDLGIMTIQNMSQPVETLSGGQRQGVAVARAAAFESRVVIMDEPTAALGVKESNRVLNLIRTLRDKGLPIILISHDMPHVFEVADRIHIQRLGRRGAIVTPQSHTMSEAVAIMTGATQVDEHGAHDLS